MIKKKKMNDKRRRKEKMNDKRGRGSYGTIKHTKNKET